MAAYFLLLLVPSLFSVLNANRVNPFLFYATAFLFIAFVGLRYSVGTDWNNYIFIHENVRTLEFSDLFRDTEPASYTIFWISAQLYNNTTLTNIVAAFISILGVFIFAHSTRHPWLAIVSATPYLIIVFFMSGIRQAMAVGIILVVMSRWQRSSQLSRCVFIILASLFHTSALVAFAFVIASWRIPIAARVLVLAGFVAAGAVFSTSLIFYSDNIAFYQDHYITADQSIISPGALIHVALIWIPAFAYIVFRKRINIYISDPRLLRMGAWFTLFLVIVYFLSSTVASRLTLYLYFVPMMFYPAFVDSFSPRKRVGVIFGIVVAHFGILAVWLLFANNAISHIPYRNLLFEY